MLKVLCENPHRDAQEEPWQLNADKGSSLKGREDTEPISIRPVAAEDLKEVLEIERSSFTRPYPPSYLETLAHLSPDTFLVAGLGDQIVGYAVFSMRGKTAHILSLAVHPERRCRRIGSALLRKVVETAKSRGASSIRLEVRKSNLPAQRLYAGAGFSPSHIAHSYYDDGEDAVIMQLAL